MSKVDLSSQSPVFVFRWPKKRERELAVYSKDTVRRSAASSIRLDVIQKRLMVSAIRVSWGKKGKTLGENILDTPNRWGKCAGNLDVDICASIDPE